MNYNDILYTLCAWNDTNILKTTLGLYDKDSDEIDILYREGRFFQIAISNNNAEICKALISFFENTQSPSEEEKDKLKEILEEETAYATLSSEMKSVLKNYLPQSEEDDRLNDFDTEEEEFIKSFPYEGENIEDEGYGSEDEDHDQSYVRENFNEYVNHPQDSSLDLIGGDGALLIT